MTAAKPPLLVNRAPVLTLWAMVVAERLGHSRKTAATLGRAVAGSSARIKARSLGLEEEPAREGDRPPRPEPKQVVRLLGRDIPVRRDGKGDLVAGGDKAGSAASALAYVAKAFGERLEEVRAAMEELAGSLDPDELNRTGFRLYEAFRPEIPPGARGWGAKGELDLDRIRHSAAGKR